MPRHRQKPPAPRPLWDRVYDGPQLAQWERDTVVLRTEAGTEYLLGTTGGVLFVPDEEFDR